MYEGTDTMESPPSYVKGDIVWVKLSGYWWPGEVINEEDLPSDLLSDFKKPPLVIVKFFDEDSYEYIKHWSNVHPYNCDKKAEYIKKGMAGFRAKLSHMAKFPKDIGTAEEKTNGNPNILSQPEFLPLKKINYDEIFGTPTPRKSAKGRVTTSAGKKSASKDYNAPHITHRRFLGTDDYQSFICVQYPCKDKKPDSDDEDIHKLNEEPQEEMVCQTCSFKTKRLGVMLMHSKMHREGVYVTTKRKPTKKAKAIELEESEADTTVPKSPKPKQRKKKEVKEKPRDIFTNLLEEWDDTDDEMDKGKTPEKKTPAKTKKKPVEKKEAKADGEAEEETPEALNDEENTSTANRTLETTETEDIISPTSTGKNTQEDIKNCFDFDEEEEEDDFLLPASTGRKIPRVIPEKPRASISELLEMSEKEEDLAKQKLSDSKGEPDKELDISTPVDPETDVNKKEILRISQSFNRAVTADDVLDPTFKELMEETVVPALDDLTESLKTEKNFHDARTIKFPDKGGTTLKGGTTSKSASSKKRFVTSFEDFETGFRKIEDEDRRRHSTDKEGTRFKKPKAPAALKVEDTNPEHQTEEIPKEELTLEKAEIVNTSPTNKQKKIKKAQDSITMPEPVAEPDLTEINNDNTTATPTYVTTRKTRGSEPGHSKDTEITDTLIAVEVATEEVTPPHEVESRRKSGRRTKQFVVEEDSEEVIEISKEEDSDHGLDDSDKIIDNKLAEFDAEIEAIKKDLEISHKKTDNNSDLNSDLKGKSEQTELSLEQLTRDLEGSADSLDDYLNDTSDDQQLKHQKKTRRKTKPTDEIKEKMSKEVLLEDSKSKRKSRQRKMSKGESQSAHVQEENSIIDESLVGHDAVKTSPAEPTIKSRRGRSRGLQEGPSTSEIVVATSSQSEVDNLVQTPDISDPGDNKEHLELSPKIKSGWDRHPKKSAVVSNDIQVEINTISVTENLHEPSPKEENTKKQETMSPLELSVAENIVVSESANAEPEKPSPRRGRSKKHEEQNESANDADTAKAAEAISEHAISDADKRIAFEVTPSKHSKGRTRKITNSEEPTSPFVLAIAENKSKEYSEDTVQPSISAVEHDLTEKAEPCKEKQPTHKSRRSSRPKDTADQKSTIDEVAIAPGREILKELGSTEKPVEPAKEIELPTSNSRKGSKHKHAEDLTPSIGEVLTESVFEDAQKHVSVEKPVEPAKEKEPTLKSRKSGRHKHTEDPKPTIEEVLIEEPVVKVAKEQASSNKLAESVKEKDPTLKSRKSSRHKQIEDQRSNIGEISTESVSKVPEELAFAEKPVDPAKEKEPKSRKSSRHRHTEDQSPSVGEVSTASTIELAEKASLAEKPEEFVKEKEPELKSRKSSRHKHTEDQPSTVDESSIEPVIPVTEEPSIAEKSLKHNKEKDRAIKSRKSSRHKHLEDQASPISEVPTEPQLEFADETTLVEKSVEPLKEKEVKSRKSSRYKHTEDQTSDVHGDLIEPVVDSSPSLPERNRSSKRGKKDVEAVAEHFAENIDTNIEDKTDISEISAEIKAVAAPSESAEIMREPASPSKRRQSRRHGKLEPAMSATHVDHKETKSSEDYVKPTTQPHDEDIPKARGRGRPRKSVKCEDAILTSTDIESTVVEELPTKESIIEDLVEQSKTSLVVEDLTASSNQPETLNWDSEYVVEASKEDKKPQDTQHILPISLDQNTDTNKEISEYINVSAETILPNQTRSDAKVPEQSKSKRRRGKTRWGTEETAFTSSLITETVEPRAVENTITPASVEIVEPSAVDNFVKPASVEIVEPKAIDHLIKPTSVEKVESKLVEIVDVPVVLEAPAAEIEVSSVEELVVSDSTVTGTDSPSSQGRRGRSQWQTGEGSIENVDVAEDLEIVKNVAASAEVVSTNESTEGSIITVSEAPTKESSELNEDKLKIQIEKSSALPLQEKDQTSTTDESVNSEQVLVDSFSVHTPPSKETRSRSQKRTTEKNPDSEQHTHHSESVGEKIDESDYIKRKGSRKHVKHIDTTSRENTLEELEMATDNNETFVPLSASNATDVSLPEPSHKVNKRKHGRHHKRESDTKNKYNQEYMTKYHQSNSDVSVDQAVEQVTKIDNHDQHPESGSMEILRRSSSRHGKDRKRKHSEDLQGTSQRTESDKGQRESRRSRSHKKDKTTHKFDLPLELTQSDASLEKLPEFKEVQACTSLVENQVQEVIENDLKDTQDAITSSLIDNSVKVSCPPKGEVPSITGIVSDTVYGKQSKDFRSGRSKPFRSRWDVVPPQESNQTCETSSISEVNKDDVRSKQVLHLITTSADERCTTTSVSETEVIEPNKYIDAIVDYEKSIFSPPEEMVRKNRRGRSRKSTNKEDAVLPTTDNATTKCKSSEAQLTVMKDENVKSSVKSEEFSIESDKNQTVSEYLVPESIDINMQPQAEEAPKEETSAIQIDISGQSRDSLVQVCTPEKHLFPNQLETFSDDVKQASQIDKVITEDLGDLQDPVLKVPEVMSQVEICSDLIEDYKLPEIAPTIKVAHTDLEQAITNAESFETHQLPLEACETVVSQDPTLTSDDQLSKANIESVTSNISILKDQIDVESVVSQDPSSETFDNQLSKAKIESETSNISILKDKIYVESVVFQDPSSETFDNQLSKANIESETSNKSILKDHIDAELVVSHDTSLEISENQLSKANIESETSNKSILKDHIDAESVVSQDTSLEISDNQLSKANIESETSNKSILNDHIDAESVVIQDTSLETADNKLSKANIESETSNISTLGDHIDAESVINSSQVPIEEKQKEPQSKRKRRRSRKSTHESQKVPYNFEGEPDLKGSLIQELSVVQSQSGFTELGSCENEVKVHATEEVEVPVDQISPEIDVNIELASTEEVQKEPITLIPQDIEIDSAVIPVSDLSVTLNASEIGPMEIQESSQVDLDTSITEISQAISEEVTPKSPQLKLHLLNESKLPESKIEASCIQETSVKVEITKKGKRGRPRKSLKETLISEEDKKLLEKAKEDDHISPEIDVNIELPSTEELQKEPITLIPQDIEIDSVVIPVSDVSVEVTLNTSETIEIPIEIQKSSQVDLDTSVTEVSLAIPEEISAKPPQLKLHLLNEPKLPESKIEASCIQETSEKVEITKKCKRGRSRKYSRETLISEDKKLLEKAKEYDHLSPEIDVNIELPSTEELQKEAITLIPQDIEIDSVIIPASDVSVEVTLNASDTGPTETQESSQVDLDTSVTEVSPAIPEEISAKPQLKLHLLSEPKLPESKIEASCIQETSEKVEITKKGKRGRSRKYSRETLISEEYKVILEKAKEDDHISPEIDVNIELPSTEELQKEPETLIPQDIEIDSVVIPVSDVSVEVTLNASEIDPMEIQESSQVDLDTSVTEVSPAIPEEISAKPPQLKLHLLNEPKLSESKIEAPCIQETSEKVEITKKGKRGRPRKYSKETLISEEDKKILENANETEKLRDDTSLALMSVEKIEIPVEKIGVSLEQVEMEKETVSILEPSVVNDQPISEEPATEQKRRKSKTYFQDIDLPDIHGKKGRPRRSSRQFSSSGHEPEAPTEVSSKSDMTNLLDLHEQPEEDAKVNSTDLLHADINIPVLEKRGRGRPRKYSKVEADIADVESPSVSTPLETKVAAEVLPTCELLKEKIKSVPPKKNRWPRRGSYTQKDSESDQDHISQNLPTTVSEEIVLGEQVIQLETPVIEKTDQSSIDPFDFSTSFHESEIILPLKKSKRVNEVSSEILRDSFHDGISSEKKSDTDMFPSYDDSFMSTSLRNNIEGLIKDIDDIDNAIPDHFESQSIPSELKEIDTCAAKVEDPNSEQLSPNTHISDDSGLALKEVSEIPKCVPPKKKKIGLLLEETYSLPFNHVPQSEPPKTQEKVLDTIPQAPKKKMQKLFQNSQAFEKPEKSTDLPLMSPLAKKKSFLFHQEEFDQVEEVLTQKDHGTSEVINKTEVKHSSEISVDELLNLTKIRKKRKSSSYENYPLKKEKLEDLDKSVEETQTIISGANIGLESDQMVAETSSISLLSSENELQPKQEDEHKVDLKLQENDVTFSIQTNLSNLKTTTKIEELSEIVDKLKEESVDDKSGIPSHIPLKSEEEASTAVDDDKYSLTSRVPLKSEENLLTAVNDDKYCLSSQVPLKLEESFLTAVNDDKSCLTFDVSLKSNEKPSTAVNDDKCFLTSHVLLESEEKPLTAVNEDKSCLSSHVSLKSEEITLTAVNDDKSCLTSYVPLKSENIPSAVVSDDKSCLTFSDPLESEDKHLTAVKDELDVKKEDVIPLMELPNEPELVPISVTPTVMSEQDLVDVQVEITTHKVIKPTVFSMDFAEPSSIKTEVIQHIKTETGVKTKTTETVGTEFTSKAMLKEFDNRGLTSQPNAYVLKSELLDILEGNSNSSTNSSGSEQKFKTSFDNYDKKSTVQGIIDFEEAIPSQIVLSNKVIPESVLLDSPKLLERLSMAAEASQIKPQKVVIQSDIKVPEALSKKLMSKLVKQTGIPKPGQKIVIKTTRPAGISSMVAKPSGSKPIILSEQIIRPANPSTVALVKGPAAQQQGIKRQYEDIEDVETAFIIPKIAKKAVEEAVVTPTPPADKPVRPRGSKGSGKAKILQQTIITPKGEIIPQTPATTTTTAAAAQSIQLQTVQIQPTADDSVFDINSMPIVLSDDLLTPESIQNMPMVLSDDVLPQSAPVPAIKTVKQQEKLLPTLPKKVLGSKQIIFKTTQPPSTTVIPAKHVSKSRILASTTVPQHSKLPKPGTKALIATGTTADGKPAKYVLVPPSVTPPTTQVQVKTAKQTIVKKQPLVQSKPSTAGVPPGAEHGNPVVGNKIMIVTNAQGQQTRVVLTPQQQKAFMQAQAGSKNKTIIKGAIPKALLESAAAVAAAGPSGMLTKTVASVSQGATTTVSSHGGLLMPAAKSVKTPVPPKKAMPRTTAKPQKTILIKNQLGQTVRKIQGTDDADLDRQVAEQLEAIKASARLQQTNKSPEIINYTNRQIPVSSTTSISNRSTIRRSYSKKIDTVTKIKIPLSTPSPEIQKQQDAIVPALAPLSPQPRIPQLQNQTPQAAPRPTTPRKVVEPAATSLASKSMEAVLQQQRQQPTVPVKSESKQSSPTPQEPERPESPLRQVVIQDGLGNLTTVTVGQILAIPSETVDGQPQSYMLVTVDESGNLTPLNNDALMSLDPSLGAGGDINNMVLQVDQGQATVATVKPAESSGAPSAPAVPVEEKRKVEERLKPELPEPPRPVKKPKPAPVEPPKPQEVPLAVEQQIVIGEGVLPGDVGGQQLIVTGDPIATQKFLESLSDGSTDLANILANAEGGSVLIQADGQQILIRTNPAVQPMMDMTESTEGGGNPMFATHRPNQDILAAALANTDVFQPTDSHGSRSSLVKGLHTSQLSPVASGLYPMHVGNVLETSLTLNSPIMTPLEVPSNNSKKIDDQVDILSQVTKNVDLPITITDPNIVQTVAQQQAASLMELSLPISESGPSVEMTSPSYSYSLPSLDDTVGMSQKTYNSSMPLLTEDIVEVGSSTCSDQDRISVSKGLSDMGRFSPHFGSLPMLSETIESSHEEVVKTTSTYGDIGSLPMLTDDVIEDSGSSMGSSKPPRSSPKPIERDIIDEGLSTLGGEMCSSLSEPPPDMFDLSSLITPKEEEISSDISSIPEPETLSLNSENSGEIPIQPHIVANLNDLKRPGEDSDGSEDKRPRFD